MLSIRLSSIYLKYIHNNKRYLYYIMSNVIYYYILRNHFDVLNKKMIYTFVLYSSVSMSYLLSLDSLEIIKNCKINKIVTKAGKSLHLYVSVFGLPILYILLIIFISNLYVVSLGSKYTILEVTIVLLLSMFITNFMILTERMSMLPVVLKLLVRSIAMIIVLLLILEKM